MNGYYRCEKGGMIEAQDPLSVVSVSTSNPKKRQKLTKTKPIKPKNKKTIISRKRAKIEAMLPLTSPKDPLSQEKEMPGLIELPHNGPSASSASVLTPASVTRSRPGPKPRNSLPPPTRRRRKGASANYVSPNKELEVVFSSKGNTMLVKNGFLYRFDKQSKSFDGTQRKYWRCSNYRNSCTARMHTTDSVNMPEYICERGFHNHPPPEPHWNNKYTEQKGRDDKTCETETLADPDPGSSDQEQLEAPAEFNNLDDMN